MTEKVKKPRRGPEPDNYPGITVYALGADGTRYPCTLFRFTCVCSIAGAVSRNVPLVAEWQDGVADDEDRERLVKRLKRMGYGRVEYVKVAKSKGE